MAMSSFFKLWSKTKLPSSIKREAPIPQLTSYESKDVSIPAEFLTETPFDAQPITVSHIDWKNSVLPEYEGSYAVVLDNVISPSECKTLLELAEASVPDAEGDASEKRPWNPALVNIGGGYEILQKDYRNSDRIIWDRQEVVDRLWERCLQAPGIKEKLSVVENDEKIIGPLRRQAGEVMGQRWELRVLNKRMRFLKYGPGQFFRPHCDGPYGEETNGKVTKTLFTLHLYLNDSVAEAGKGADLVGGATSFLSNDETRKMDVDPKAGRVLIFQHLGLLHSGDDVKKGVKYTMRTDIMYDLIRL